MAGFPGVKPAWPHRVHRIQFKSFLTGARERLCWRSSLRSCTFWYHDHAVGITAENAYFGLAAQS